jgi:hypothetical protein
MPNPSLNQLGAFGGIAPAPASPRQQVVGILAWTYNRVCVFKVPIFSNETEEDVERRLVKIFVLKVGETNPLALCARKFYSIGSEEIPTGIPDCLALGQAGDRGWSDAVGTLVWVYGRLIVARTPLFSDESEEDAESRMIRKVPGCFRPAEYYPRLDLFCPRKFYPNGAKVPPYWYSLLNSSPLGIHE